MSGGNNWLSRQRKADLVDLAGAIGLTNYEKLLKTELEAAIDDYVSTNLAAFQTNPKLREYFKSRARAEGSPVKKEPPVYEPKLSKRRQSTKLAEEVIVDPSPATSFSQEEAEVEEEEDSEQETITAINPLPSGITSLVPSSNALTTVVPTTTPSRLSRALHRLPASPSDVAQAVESSTLALRTKLSDLYSDSGLPEATQTTREFLSSVHSVLSTIALFELYKLRQELLPDRYAFTFPAVSLLGTQEYPVKLPDMFALVTSDFWIPALTWGFTSLVVPGLVGYFYNLSGVGGGQQSSGGGRGRPKRGGSGGYEVDPLVFSLVKGILTYVVYAQGVTFGGLIGDETVGRINGALYSGWKGVLVGTGVAGLVSVYDAVLKK
ncbi:hypothetical protein QBC38DRAFT_471725 [Podospora fimiseda]|uniref:Uncharacterized protein n=1 Tax=Podospora fimiseda TaxID=252190 RepID=A0AAN7BTY5_9PEZI|nr:hypothetical protein QBC38DRAFT_471725 [Podospora fimiseda]